MVAGSLTRPSTRIWKISSLAASGAVGSCWDEGGVEAARDVKQKQARSADPGKEARKRPRQERSRHTVDAMVTAAARVLRERGVAGLTTNHIARAAGVSVGSLYQ